jgi:hypothetical protein
MFKHACKTGLEGVVSEVRDSIYPIGRSNNWVKVTCAQRETLTIAGFALDGSKWDGLYVGRREGDQLIYAGKVDHGFDTASAKMLRARLTPLIRNAALFQADRPSSNLGRARAARRDRVSGEIRRRQNPPPLLQGAAGGSVMWARFAPFSDGTGTKAPHGSSIQRSEPEAVEFQDHDGRQASSVEELCQQLNLAFDQVESGQSKRPAGSR